jgi:hypothetical protein
MEDLTTLPLELTGLEVVFLLDSLRNAGNFTEAQAEFDCLEDLVLKLASLYRELVTPDGIAPGPLRVEVNEAETWLLRAKVRTGDVGIDGTTNVGVPLSLKLYELMARFEADVDEYWQTAAEDGERPLTAEQQAAFMHRYDGGQGR